MTDRVRPDSLARLRAGFVFLLVLFAAFVLATAAAGEAADRRGLPRVPCTRRHAKGQNSSERPSSRPPSTVTPGLSCVDCHADLAKLKELPHKEKLKAVSCSACHDGMAEKHPFHPMMASDPEVVPCQDCHGGHDVVASPRLGFRATPSKAPAPPATRTEVEPRTPTSVHGQAVEARREGGPDLPHLPPAGLALGGGGARRRPASRPRRSSASPATSTAPKCARASPSAGFIAAYEKSVHGRALLAGNANAANCVDCHGAHEIRKPATRPSSRSNRRHIQESCAKCHSEDRGEVREERPREGARERERRDAPTCTTCHGEHGILKHTDPRSPVAAANVSAKVCTPCHGSLRLSEKYGIESDRFQTFEDSFHGLAVRGGAVEVANCASCHGAHDILPSSDPASTINKANLARTCGALPPRRRNALHDRARSTSTSGARRRSRSSTGSPPSTSA